MMKRVQQVPIIAVAGVGYRPDAPLSRASGIAVATVSRRGRLAEQSFSGAARGVTPSDLVSEEFGVFPGMCGRTKNFDSDGDLWAAFSAHMNAELERCPRAEVVSWGTDGVLSYIDLWQHSANRHPDARLSFEPGFRDLRAEFDALGQQLSIQEFVKDRVSPLVEDMRLRDPLFFAAAATGLAMRKMRNWR
jgi:hypothetical protein